MVPFTSDREQQVLALSMAAWAPVFEKLRPAVPSYVYQAFYHQGWRVRQTTKIQTFLKAEAQQAWVMLVDGVLSGWVGIRLHPETQWVEVYILAVHPDYQRLGLARALMDHAMTEMRRAGMAVVMVETGDDPGHVPSRVAYERAGFERWPVARYFRAL